jgi:hypothetical protein
MSVPSYPTPFAEANAVLGEFFTNVHALLGSHLVGMYGSGSLALGAFDPLTSDIDFVVVTDADLPDDLFTRLQDLHARFAASGSRWAARIEAVYIPEMALRHPTRSLAPYPQIEQGTTLQRMPLESGWMFQRYTLREHGVVVSGPAPWTLIDPITPDDLRRATVTATAEIVGEWSEHATHDPSWLAWLRPREHRAFVGLTRFRLLYSFATARVASKPGAAEWAQPVVGQPWSTLIARALMGQLESGEISADEVNDTVAFIHYTLDHIPSR